MRTLYQGTRGKDVENLQYFLGIKVDGSFGPATRSEVMNKQRSTGLAVDGYVGPATQKKWGLSDFRVHIYNKGDVWFAGTPYVATYKPLKSLATWAAEEGADYVYNLAFFNMSGSGSDKYGVIKGRTVTYLKAKGFDVGYGGVDERITIDSQNICGGYKVAIKDGKSKYVPSFGKRCRNANGILMDGRYFHVQSVTTSTEAAIRNHMLNNYRVDLMLIQDAGGSTGFYDRKKKVLLAGEREGSGGRPVASVVCVKKKDSTTLPVEPVPTPVTMVSPYKGRFKVSQTYKGAAHKGLDLVGLDSKQIFSTVNGVVEASQMDTHPTGGMGLYIRIRAIGGERYYFAHLSQSFVKVGDNISKGQLIGAEGSTGNSTGSHLHYEIRMLPDNTTFLDVPAISGIPNILGIYGASNSALVLAKKAVQEKADLDDNTMQYLADYPFGEILIIKLADAMK